jgi:nucleotide-binding universal stress UspA family protein
MNIRTILCPSDLSDTSRHALDYASAIARWYSARIIGLHVHTGHSALAGAGAMEAAGSRELDKAAYMAALRHELDDATRAGRTDGLEVDTEVVDGSATASVISAYAARSAVDLIVIGTHGLGGFRHLILGSVTEAVLRQASCPVLAVPPRAQTTSTLPFKRLLWPTDFSSSSLAALEMAFAFTQEAQAGITLMHVLDEADEQALFVARSYDIHRHARDAEQRASEQLLRLVPDAVRDWGWPAIRVVRGIASEEILRVAEEESTDLIVMGIQGRKPLDLMMFGSTTNQVVRRARCPVLTVRR